MNIIFARINRLIAMALLVCVVLVGLPQAQNRLTVNPPDPANRSADRSADRSANGPVTRQPIEGTVTLNFLNSNLEDVVKGVSAMTGMRFLISPDLRTKTISLVTQTPIPVNQVYDALLSMLRSYRLSAVEADGIISIVPETEAWPQVQPNLPQSPDSQLVSKMVKLDNVTATVAANIIRPLLSQKGFPLVPNNNNNSLMIVDYASNIRNLEILLKSLDQIEQRLPVVFPVNHLSVLDAENSLKQMLQSPPIGSSTGFSLPVTENIFSDVPNNRLLVRAGTERLVYIAQLLAFIDVPRKSSNLINIYPLKYTNAESMAKTLQNLLSNKTAGNNAAPRPANNPATNAATPTTSNTSSSGDIIDLSTSGVNIQADPATNSLIIAAPENLYRNIVDIVRKLDVRRKQIFVEILIADVQGERVNEFGVQWLAGNGYNSSNASVVGAANFGPQGITSVAQNPLSVGTGLSLGVVKGTINIPGIGQITNLAMLARALETRINANILSSPNLLVLNNEESKLIVGTNVPVITGQYSTTGASTNPFQTIERKDVGVNLRLKPQIMDSGVILLDIYQEVSDILSTGTSGPTTSKRSLESKIMLDNGQIMVLGGLISEKQNDDVSQVPILSQIPILGRLFSYTKKTHSKSNLMLFIRPTIVNDEFDGAQLTDLRYQNLYNMLPYEGENLAGFGDRTPVLPPKPAMPSLRPELPSSIPLPAQSLPSRLEMPQAPSPFAPEPQGAKPLNPDLAKPVMSPPNLIQNATMTPSPPSLAPSTNPPPVANSAATAVNYPQVIFVPKEDEDGALSRLNRLRAIYRKTQQSELQEQLYPR